MSDQNEEERPARRRAAQSCDNPEHVRLLAWHDMWMRSATEHDSTEEQRREALKMLEHKLLAAEAQVRYLLALGTTSGLTFEQKRHAVEMEQSRGRERLWREEFETVRQERGEAIDRAIAAEELVEQGLLRESMLIRHLEKLAAAPYLFQYDAGVYSCAQCGGHTTKLMAEPTEIQHLRGCTLLAILSDIQRWREDGGLARERAEGELGRLRAALVASGTLEKLAECPSCGADRTNGEWHKEKCSLVPIMAQQERRRAI